MLNRRTRKILLGLAGVCAIYLYGKFETYVLPILNSSEAPSFTSTAKTPSSQKRISIMTYNVENLFDTKDDPNKDDETFLPLLKKKNKSIIAKCKKSRQRHWVDECLKTNWNSYKLDLKMKRLAKVIKAYKNGGADILILQEVENMNVLSQFNKKHLGYPTEVLLEGPDRRGIDVALLSKLKVIDSPKLHLQKFSSQNNFLKGKNKPTRGILDVKLELPNKEALSVLGVHFPSQGSPTVARKKAVGLLNDLKRKKKGLVIAGGDFNITSSEEKKNKIFKNTIQNLWNVSHIMGCKKCKGTTYYHRRRSWSFFDVLLFSKNFNKTWKVDKKSIDVFNDSSIQNNRHGSPARFNMGENQTGVSDHWPVVAEIYL